MSEIQNIIRLTSVFSGNGFEILNNKLKQSARQVGELSKNVSGKALQSLNNNLKSTSKEVFSLSSLMNKLMSTNLLNYSINFGRQLIETSKNLGALHSRFYAITKDDKLANEELKWTINLAQKTATNINTVTDAYSIFYATARNSLGQENTRQIMQDWTEISRVIHLAPDQFQRVMYAMRELSSKGSIYADDVKRQLGGAVPDAIKFAEKAARDLGVTGSDWFKSLQKMAQGNQKVVNQFMIAFTKYAHEALASPEALRKSLQQTDSIITALTNTWQIFLMNLAESGGTEEIIKTVRGLNTFLEKITKQAPLILKLLKLSIFLFGSIAVGSVFEKIINAVKIIQQSRILTLLKNLPWLATLFKSGGKIGMFSGMKGLFGPGWTKFARILTPLMPFLTNPWVIGALLLTALIPVGMWVLKKFFPNVYDWVIDILTIIKAELLNLYNKFTQTPLGQQIFGDPVKPIEDKASNILEKQYSDIKAHGGYYANDKYGGFFDVWGRKALLGQLKTLATTGPVERRARVSAEIVHKFQSDGSLGTQELREIARNEIQKEYGQNTGLAKWLGNAFNSAVKKMFN